MDVGTSKSRSYSSFFVTINTNMRVPIDETRKVAAYLRHTLSLMYKGDNILGIIKFLNGKKQYSQIKEADVEFAIERGTSVKGSRLHAHCLVRIFHNSRIHLDRVAIKEFVMEDMNIQLKANGYRPLSSVYVNIRAMRGSEFNLVRYLEKTGKSKRLV
jgi:hypothetical protein